MNLFKQVQTVLRYPLRLTDNARGIRMHTLFTNAIYAGGGMVCTEKGGQQGELVLARTPRYTLETFFRHLIFEKTL